MERLCINCAHFRAPEQFGNTAMGCAALRGDRDPVLGGNVDTIDPGLMRLTACGWSDPKLFEPKDI
jgi:hypothetical protein